MDIVNNDLINNLLVPKLPDLTYRLRERVIFLSWEVLLGEGHVNRTSSKVNSRNIY